jgi:hypothetical protein
MAALGGALVSLLLGAPTGCGGRTNLGGEGPPSGYTPCAGLRCGAACTLCPPDDATCVETQATKVCDMQGDCVPAAASMAECPSQIQ